LSELPKWIKWSKKKGRYTLKKCGICDEELNYEGFNVNGVLHCLSCMYKMEKINE